jgi:hypothetical protein
MTKCGFLEKNGRVQNGYVTDALNPPDEENYENMEPEMDEDLFF